MSERLKSMCKETHGDGLDSCLVCAAVFGFIRNRPRKCSLCQMVSAQAGRCTCQCMFTSAELSHSFDRIALLCSARRTCATGVEARTCSCRPARRSPSRRPGSAASATRSARSAPLARRHLSFPLHSFHFLSSSLRSRSKLSLVLHKSYSYSYPLTGRLADPRIVDA